MYSVFQRFINSKNVGKWAEEISGSFSLARPKSACPKAAQIPTMFL
jgi:hypothetical protein